MKYYDDDGKECSLDVLCRDPEWAANRLREAERKLAEMRYLAVHWQKTSDGCRAAMKDASVTESIKREAMWNSYKDCANKTFKVVGDGEIVKPKIGNI